MQVWKGLPQAHPLHRRGRGAGAGGRAADQEIADGARSPHSLVLVLKAGETVLAPGPCLSAPHRSTRFCGGPDGRQGAGAAPRTMAALGRGPAGGMEGGPASGARPGPRRPGARARARRGAGAAAQAGARGAGPGGRGGSTGEAGGGGGRGARGVEAGGGGGRAGSVLSSVCQCWSRLQSVPGRKVNLAIGGVREAPTSAPLVEETEGAGEPCRSQARGEPGGARPSAASPPPRRPSLLWLPPGGRGRGGRRRTPWGWRTCRGWDCTGVRRGGAREARRPVPRSRGVGRRPLPAQALEDGGVGPGYGRRGHGG